VATDFETEGPPYERYFKHLGLDPAKDLDDKKTCPNKAVFFFHDTETKHDGVTYLVGFSHAIPIFESRGNADVSIANRGNLQNYSKRTRWRHDCMGKVRPASEERGKGNPSNAQAPSLVRRRFLILEK
jgi:hypothetical protein